MPNRAACIPREPKQTSWQKPQSLQTENSSSKIPPRTLNRVMSPAGQPLTYHFEFLVVSVNLFFCFYRYFLKVFRWSRVKASE
jgi:hypothetical protein